MPDELPVDWDPRSEEVQADQIAAYDAMRARCPVAHSPYRNWTVFGHADTIRILDDPATYSNAVSAHLSVPNGMDPPEHTGYRAINDRYFTPDRMRAFEPECRDVARTLVDALPDGDTEIMAALAEPFANHIQCRFMGWPDRLHEPLRQWTRKNREATRALDREAMSAIAVEFDGYIREQLDERRAAAPGAPADVTAELLADRVDDRPLTDPELVSLIRNWTVGELSTIAACVGIIVHHLAEHPDLQSQLRADPGPIAAACDEILRMRAPLIANRRRTTREVTIGDRVVPENERIMVLWASANRDEKVFGDPDEFRLDRDPDDNLLYGRGIHRCPGAPLARLELTVLVEELLASTTSIDPVPGTTAHHAAYPAGGFTTVPVTIGREAAP
ncbi:MAG: cytochrome P450 [Rhodococcus sp.]|uniref:cytochrome P450 n=1 Tax=Rhodococcus TaxID=1827 RepID=UPI0016AB6C94|nr:MULTISPECIES: cytochrome P450 [Rhodococcus]NLV79810.1 cytochrome P450 [Rhodococcus sp. (in: high G+C Gram-positive bacteria)]